MNHAWLPWTIAALIASFSTSAIAQIIPDDTMGNERSTVLQNATFNSVPLEVTINGVVNPIDVIINGARRGNTVFHSFSQFNAALDRGTYFFAPDGQIQNIVARVTGSTPSNILGRLGTFQIVSDQLRSSNANLFLINPNGILFGDNASLEIGGALIATTANAVRFGNSTFSATNPEPVTDVLQINPSAFLFNRIPTADITVRSNAPNGLRGVSGLAPETNLLLLGGNVNLEGGRLSAPGGRVEIGAVAGTGEIGLNLANGSLSIPEGVPRAEVQLSNAATIDVSLLQQGNIGITANNIRLSGASQLIAGVNTGGGSRDSQAGDIHLNATGTVELTEASRIENTVNRGFTGKSGDINLTATALFAAGGSQISASTFGTGDAGNVNIRVRDRVQFTGEQSGVFTGVESDATGNGGNIFVAANTLELIDGAQLIGNTSGVGDAGNITVDVRDRVFLTGFEGELRSTIFSRVETTGIGQGGNIKISANTLEMTNGARINAATLGQGDAGNVRIEMRDRVRLDDGVIFSTVPEGVKGNGGDLFVSANTLEMINGARLNASTSGTGDAGSVTLQISDRIFLYNSNVFSSIESGGVGKGGGLFVSAKTLEMINGSGLNASTSGTGDAGSVTLQIGDRIFLDNSNVFSSVEPGAIGKGGNLFVSANVLDMRNSAQLVASTNGTGDAGNVTVQVRDRILLTDAAQGDFRTGIFSSVGSNGIGNGGDLFISTTDLELFDRARFTTSTSGQGNAGDVRIEARGQVLLDDSTIFSRVERNVKGNGGSLFVSANTLELRNGGQFTASSFGNGTAGDVTVQVRDRMSVSGRSPDGELTSTIFSTLESGGVGKGGNLFVSANTLEVNNGGRLTASTFGEGDAGNVRIEVGDRFLLSNGVVFSSVEQGATGNGGNLFVSAGTVTMKDGAQFLASTRGTGNAGNVTVQVRDRLSLNGSTSVSGFTSAIFSSVFSEGIGNGGSLEISADTLELINGAQLLANTTGNGNAGNIVVGHTDRPIRSIVMSGTNEEGFSSGMLASTDSGLGGNIRINADQIQMTDGAVIDARTYQTGNSGTIDIQTQTLDLLRGSQILALTQGSGSANSITINATDRLSISGVDSTYADRANRFGSGRVGPISQFSGIYTRSAAPENAGSAGSIFLTAPRIELDDRARIDAQSSTVDGGNISIRAVDRLLLRNNSQITATAGTETGFGNGGNINIDARFIIAIPKENSDISANASQGSGGRVTLNVTGGVLGIEARSQNSLLSDITATSAQGPTGVVTLNTPDTNSLQNSLTQLSQTEINTNELLANSCIVRDQQNGSFYITGTGGLPAKPTDLSNYPTGTIQSPVDPGKESSAEPQGIYQLPNGKLVMVRNCPN